MKYARTLFYILCTKILYKNRKTYRCGFIMKIMNGTLDLLGLFQFISHVRYRYVIILFTSTMFLPTKQKVYVCVKATSSIHGKVVRPCASDYTLISITVTHSNRCHVMWLVDLFSRNPLYIVQTFISYFTLSAFNKYYRNLFLFNKIILKIK